MRISKKLAAFALAGFFAMCSHCFAQGNYVDEKLDVSPIHLAAEDSAFEATVEEKEEKGGVFKGVIDFYENTRKFQTGLSEKGYSFELGHTNDTGMNFGGLRRSRTAVKSMSVLDVSLTVDTEKAGLWKGGTAFILGQTIYGKGLTDSRLNDIQTISSIEAPARTQLSEYWYEQKLFEEKFRVAAGKTDANGEFGILPMAEDYLGSSFTLMPNIPMPSYPDQAVGTWGEITPVSWLGLKAGIFDGGGRGDDLGLKTAFEGRKGYITLLQTELKPSINNHQGSYIFGYWTHTGDLETIGTDDVQFKNNNYGLYTEFQQMVYRENDEDDQGLSLLGQFSWAPSNRNEIERYYGAGATYKGVLPKRNEDVLGVGLALADLSKRYKVSDGLQNEAAIELFYKIVFNEVFTLQPDFQIIVNNGGSRETSFAVGLRTIISFAPREAERI